MREDECPKKAKAKSNPKKSSKSEMKDEENMSKKPKQKPSKASVVFKIMIVFVFPSAPVPDCLLTCLELFPKTRGRGCLPYFISTWHHAQRPKQLFLQLPKRQHNFANASITDSGLSLAISSASSPAASSRDLLICFARLRRKPSCSSRIKG